MIETGSDWFKNDVHPYYQFKKAHDNSIESLAFNPANNLEMVTGSNDKSIKIWDLQKFKPSSKFTGHTGGVWATTFSQDGKVIISGSSDKSIMFWDVKNGKPISQLKENSSKTYWLKVSQDGKQLLSCGEEGRISIWDMRKMALVKMIQAANDVIVYNVDFLPGNKFIMSSDSNGMLKAYDTLQYELKAQSILKPRLSEKAFCLKALPNLVDGKIKILAGYQHKVLKQFSFDPEAPKFTLEYDQQTHMDSVTSVSVTKGIFATGSRDGSARVWDIIHQNGKYKLLANLIGHKQKIAQLAFQPSVIENQAQSILATCSWDQNINLYKV